MAESKGFEPLRQGYPPTRFPIVLLRPLGQLSINMAPQVGLEPTTDRLTADSSTTELLRNDKITAWQRPTLTGTCVPTTIGAEKLNFRVRYGNGCDLLALITRLFIRHYFIIMSFMDFSREIFNFFHSLKTR